MMLEQSKEKAVVVLSGGQDSTTLLFWAIKQYGRSQVSAIGFDYGQKHVKELSVAKAICDRENIDYKILDLKLLGQLAPNALTRHDMDMDSEQPEGSYPNTFVEGRNHLFLSFVAVVAKQMGARNIITGVCETDFSGYPDCRDIFVKSLQVTLSLAMDYNFVIHTPLMWLNKAQTWALADELSCIDIIKNETLTCYNGIVGDGCMECPACKLRKKGYDEYIKNKENAK